MSTAHSTPLGWCLTGHHDRCPGSVRLSMQNRDQVCTCTCHTAGN